jgi:hypothetical protein
MCFSASASFTASAVLFVSGIVAVRKIKDPKNNFHFIPFAAIPFLFGLQQFSEGFVWLSLTHSYSVIIHQFSTGFFLVFAQVLWPVFVPFSIYLLENDSKRKKTLFAISIFGSLVAGYLAYCLLTFPFTASIRGNHIFYVIGFKHTEFAYSGIFYFIPTVFPALISSTKYMVYFGLTILVSFIFSKFFYGEYVISVWCFFAATLSVIITFIIWKANEIGSVKKIPIE